MEFNKSFFLNDAVDVLGDGLHGTPNYNEKGEYYFINGNNLKGGQIILKEGTKRVDQETFQKYKKDLNDRTILVSINGTIGNVALYNNEKVILGKSACYFNVKRDINKNYIKYLLMDKRFQDYIKNYATGTTILNVSLKTMRNFEFYLPDLHTQNKVTSILENIDSLIENNKAIIDNLENISQTLFKHWFIDFEFPNEEGKPYKSSGGEMVESELKEIPKGWNLSVINDIAYQKKDKVNLDKTSNEFNYIGLEHMPQGNIALGNWEGSNKVSGNKNLFKKDDILFGKLRPYFKKVGIAPIEGVCSTDIIVINSEEAHLKSYLFLNLIQDDFIQYTSNTATGTRMPRTSWKIMSNYKIVLPDEHILVKFEEAISPILQKVNSIIHENKNLTQLRDTLLPKLLSGEIEIPDDLEM